MSAERELVADLYGRDPLRGDDAQRALLQMLGARAIESVVPLRGCRGPGSTQVEYRLESLARSIGSSAIPWLARVIQEGEWQSKRAAARCFGAFTFHAGADQLIVAILDRGADFDAERMAVEALAWMGADQWADRLTGYARTGSWRSLAQVDDDYISDYAFGKLAAYVIEALAVFAARSRSGADAAVAVSRLTELILLRDRYSPNVSPSAFQVAARHAEAFQGTTIDAIIAQWGTSPHEELRALCIEVLGHVASGRGARFLLDLAADPSATDRLRRLASIALGEARDARTAALLADHLRDPARRTPALVWAFSALRSVPADWRGLEGWEEEILQEGGEPGAQLAWSLALRGERRILPQLVRRLDDSESFQRWSAALALARLEGEAARSQLAGRADEAGSPLERCGILAAEARAGASPAFDALHASLRDFGELTLVRSIWRQELVEVFRTSPAGQRAFDLWRVAANVRARHLQNLEDLVAREVVTREPGESRPVSRSQAVPAQRSQSRLFISYSHHYPAWLERFQVMLRPLFSSDQLDVWDDTRLETGKWRDQIEAAMRSARVALLLVSDRFLASEYITGVELPELIQRSAVDGVHIVWCLVDDCLWEATILEQYHGENPDRPLTLMSPGEQSQAIKQVCLKIRRLVESTSTS
jgi:hypothetical protein